MLLIGDFKEQDLSNPAWALAKMQLEDTPLLEAIASSSIHDIFESCAQSITMLAWAFASFGWEHTPLLNAISSQSLRICADFQAPDISGIAWSLATLVLQDVPLISALSEAAIQMLTNFDSVTISITAWSWARFRIIDVPLIDAISASAIAKLQDFGAQEIGNTAWAISVFSVADGTLLDALAQKFLATSETPGSSTRASAPDSSDGGGVEWVEVASAVTAAAHRSGHALVGNAAKLEAVFAEYLFWPLVRSVVDLANPLVSHSGAYQRLSNLVDELGAAHLGPDYTRLALPLVSRSRRPPKSWVEGARAAVGSALGGRVGAGTTERCVVFAAACLVWRDEVVELPNRVYMALPRGPPQPIGDCPEDRARALIRHVHRHVLRDNHAERAALLAAMTAAVRLTGDGGEDGIGSVLAECTGGLRLYGSHVPCISCVCALAQFNRFLPAVVLEVEFEDAWRTSQSNYADLPMKREDGTSR